MSKFKKNTVIVCFVISCVLVINIFAIKPGHLWGDDFALYILQKNYIVEYESDELEKFVKFRHDNSTAIGAPKVYPWGYPLVLSFLTVVFGAGIYGYVVANMFFLAASLLVLYKYFSDTLELYLLVLMLLVIGLNPVLFEIKNSVLSDTVAFFFSFFAILLVQRSLCLGNFSRICVFIAGSIALFISYYLRTQYAVLLLSAFFIVAIEEYRRKLVYGDKNCFRSVVLYGAMLFAVFFVLMYLSRYREQFVSSYSDLLVGYNVVHTIRMNLVYYASVFTGSWANVFSYSSGVKAYGGVGCYVVGIVLVPAFLMGIISSFKCKRDAVLVALFGLVVPLFYPYRGDIRLVFFCYPFYLWFVMLGLGRSVDSKLVCLYQVVSKVLIVYVVMFYLFVNVRNGLLYRSSGFEVSEGPFKQTSTEMWNFVASTGKQDTFAFFKAGAFYLFTGRLVATFKRIDEIDPGIIDYVILYKYGEVMDFEYADECDSKFSRVFSNSDFLIYRTKGVDGQ